jgi:hypothetical protein
MREHRLSWLPVVERGRAAVAGVTGPTGTVGAPLVGLLADQGLPVVAGAREPTGLAGSAECRLWRVGWANPRQPISSPKP